jgi:hypothetical protein
LKKLIFQGWVQCIDRGKRAREGQRKDLYSVPSLSLSHDFVLYASKREHTKVGGKFMGDKT